MPRAGAARKRVLFTTTLVLALFLFASSAHGHGFLAKPPSKNGGNQSTRAIDSIYYSVASFGIVDKAFFDGDHSVTPWTQPGGFDYKMAKELVPDHPQTLHPCGCNGGGVAHCVGVDGLATGFGETTLGAAPGVPPVLTPPQWAAGSVQEVGWNAYANHAGGYLYTLCRKEAYDACRDEHMPQGGSAASDIQTSAYLACVWGCFEATTLEWVPDSQKVQFRDDICTYARTDPLTKVGKDDHVWRSTPIPDKGQVSSGNEGRCTWDSVVGFSSVVAKERFTASFGASDVCDYGPHQRSTKNWHVMDQVQIPGSLPAGEYLLGWRWDAYMADQMWTGCADVQIVPFSTPSTSSSEADCPPAPPTTYPPPGSPPPSPGGPLGGCTDNALPGNWGAAGRTCGTYEALGGSAYCAHQALAESCCFCRADGGGANPPPPVYSAPTPPSPPLECTDASLPGNWGAAGRTCGTYEAHGGSAYCAHQALAESCCFCGGGSL